MFCADRLCLKPNLHFSSSSTLAEVLVSGCLVIKLRKVYADRLTWRPADDARDD